MNLKADLVLSYTLKLTPAGVRRLRRAGNLSRALKGLTRAREKDINCKSLRGF